MQTEVEATGGLVSHPDSSAVRADAWFVRCPPIFAVAIAVVGGDALGNYHIFFPLWMAVLAAVVAFGLFLVRRSGAGVAFALIGILLASTLPVRRVLTPYSGPESLRRFPAGTLLTVTGRLIRSPELFPRKTRIYVAASGAQTPNGQGLPVRGVVRVTVLDCFEQFRVGDEVRFTGRIHFPRNYGDPGEFDYQGYMARQGIAATALALQATRDAPIVAILGHHPSFPASEIETVRNHIAAFIAANLDEPVAAEMRALVIGERGGISQRLRNTFARTGMAHLLVISGLHLGMVAAATFALVRLLMLMVPGLAARGWSNKIAALAAIVTVSAYASIAGHHISTERALIMVLAYMFAVVMDRPREALASLSLAAIVICIALPGSSANISFQLSFLAVLAIVLGMRRFMAWVERRRMRLPRFARPRRSPLRTIALVMAGYVAVSFWALLGTAPLAAYYFNQFSLVGLIANAVVVPIMGFGGTVLGLAAAGLSFVWTPGAAALLWVAGRMVEAGNGMARWFVGWPFAWTRTFTPTPLEIALAYGALFLWLTWPERSRTEPQHLAARAGSDSGTSDADGNGARDGDGGGGRGRAEHRWPGWRRWRWIAVAALAIAVVADAGWWTYQRNFNPDLRVTFLAVGEGDAVVVRFPGSQVMLIDCGGAWHGFSMGERIVARYLWSRKIMRVDWMVLSHPDLDDFGGFEFVARAFNPGQFWTLPVSRPELSYVKLLTELSALKIPLRYISDSAPPLRDGGATLRVLNAPTRLKTGNSGRSLVVRIADRGQSFLFTGAIQAPQERMLIRSGHDLRATVLDVPHHGSHTASTMGFIKAVSPRVAVISLGYRNRFHLPAASVLERYRREGARIERTDLDGAVFARVLTNGRLELSTWRSKPAP